MSSVLGRMTNMHEGEVKPPVTPHLDSYCSTHDFRLCGDGSCVSRLDLCPDEKKVNQHTSLIMIIIGIAVVIAMIILYCFQQRSRRLSRANQGALETIVGDGDNTSLNNPPPTYDEVIGSNLYLPTSQSQQRNGVTLSRLLSAEEPITPPPNYDAALTILAQSHESFFLKSQEERSSSIFRRSISTETTSPASPTRSSS